jgi:signal transduction histidine kinase
MAQQRLTPEMLVTRLGDYLVSRGHISAEELQRALDHQQERNLKGEACILGQALLDLKLIERATLDQSITEQIIQLRSALQASNRNLERRVQERTSDLQEALQRLSQLSQMKANFIANISHELRTPLTHVKGYLELLVTESLGPITEEQRHALHVSQHATGKLQDMIEDLIMFSLASRGEMSMKQVPTDIGRLAEAVVNSAMQKGEARGVSVNIVADDNLPLVQADPEKIGWVLTQLLDNGIKFTPSAGCVSVNIKKEGANLVMISVVDTGIGIPLERMDEIFEPFHQLDGSSTRPAGGTGLGLSLIRQIVEAHGSLLDVISVEGKGSTFKFPLLEVPGKRQNNDGHPDT